MNKSDLLQQVRGSMTVYEKLTEDNLKKLGEKGLTCERVREIIEAAGLDYDNIVVDPTRFIYNAYYADYENGIYFDLHLDEQSLTHPQVGVSALALQHRRKDDFLKQGDWIGFYHRDVPGPLRIYDFQRRYKDISEDRVYEVWEFIHRNIDYENGQWTDEVLDYVFDRAPRPKELPLNENGTVTVYRGSGSRSQSPERALSWSSNQRNALWFANHNGFGQALYIGEVASEDVVNYMPGFHQENEVIVRRGAVRNLRKADMIPIEQETMTKLLVPIIPELLSYGRHVAELGYPSEGIFQVHGRGHILRVLALSLIFYYHSGRALSERDKNILIYFSLLHDIGRSDDGEDTDHGKRSVEMIERNPALTEFIRLNKIDREIAHLIIRYHSRSDEDGEKAIIRFGKKKKPSVRDLVRLADLYKICKDMDGLDRVRFNGLDIDQLRSEYARKLPLVAGRLLHEKIEAFVLETPKVK